MSVFQRLAADLSCPVCHMSLRLCERRLTCSHSHSFDLARQGYVSLLSRASPGRGDTAVMVSARESFLNQGHFRPLYRRLEQLLATLLPQSPRLLTDLGAGTGHLTAALLERWPDALGLALDLSKPACKKAARRHPRLMAVVSDITARLPLQDACAGLVLSSFAPRRPAEISRILAPEGLLAVISPEPDHAQELRAALNLIGIEPEKLKRLDRSLSLGFRLLQREPQRFKLELTPAEISSFVSMGPNAWHQAPEALHSDLQALTGKMTVQAAFCLSIYQPKSALQGVHHES